MKTLGIALGAGGARGLAHIGVLKVLHKHKITPNYIAGTSMGAVIGALYATGHTPEQMEAIAKTTRWKEIVDFTIPKKGLISGNVAQERLGKLLFDKRFDQLEYKLQIVAYNLNQNTQVIFSKGDLTQAVRASISIPGVFTPARIHNQDYIDGAVANPTPFDVARDMGADVVMAVDLFTKGKKIAGPTVQKSNFFKVIKRKFVTEELSLVKQLIFPDRWPKILKKFLLWSFDKLLYPARVLRVLAGRQVPPIVETLHNTTSILIDNLARERLRNSDVDVKVLPKFGSLTWTDFDQVETFVKLGEKAMNKHIAELKQKLR